MDVIENDWYETILDNFKHCGYHGKWIVWDILDIFQHYGRYGQFWTILNTVDIMEDYPKGFEDIFGHLRIVTNSLDSRSDAIPQLIQSIKLLAWQFL